MGRVALERLPGVTFLGSPIADETVLADVPPALAEVLREVNGVVAFRGGLHIRGVVDKPAWHSLVAVWKGEGALWRHYRSLTRDDVPFGEDALGDQYFLRQNDVWRLFAETDDAQLVARSLEHFLESCQRDLIEALSLEPLMRLENEGSQLKPGELINVYPPFCTKQAASGNVSLRAVPAKEQLYFLTQVASTMRDLPEGAEVQFKAVD